MNSTKLDTLFFLLYQNIENDAGRFSRQAYTQITNKRTYLKIRIIFIYCNKSISETHV